jgi:hypothetical protein
MIAMMALKDWIKRGLYAKDMTEPATGIHTHPSSFTTLSGELYVSLSHAATDARERKSQSYPKYLSVGITHTIDDEV